MCQFGGLLPRMKSCYLLGELLLTQLVEGEELAGQIDVVYEATAGQLHPDDDLTVRHHHGHRAEVDLQVLRKLLATSVAWVLGKGGKNLNQTCVLFLQ